MCFSPEVDLIAGITLTTIGVDTLRHVEHPSERPLAALPLIFGIHQGIEAVVWWGVDGEVAGAAAEWSAWFYLAVAFGMLPWFVPWAVRRMETHPTRRALMSGFTVLGGLISIILMAAVARGPVEVADGGTYLIYEVPLSHGGLLVAAYIAATCGSLLLSSDRVAVQFGAINLGAVIVLAAMLSSGFISLWCVWAAVVSGAIALHLRRTSPHGHRAQPAEATA